MRRPAFPVAAALLGLPVLLLSQSIQAQLLIKPTMANTASANAEEVQSLNKQLQETQDRLHAFENDNEALRRRNDSSKQTIHTLTESLAVANAECEVFRRQYSDLKLRMEALGLASVGDNKEALEQRLLKSVSDLKLLRDEKDKIAERMVALTESVLLYLKTATSNDPQLRLQIEAELRGANEAVAETSARDNGAIAQPPGTLMNGQVLSVNEGMSLVVGNIGTQQGVKVGMPFLILRGDHLVAHGRAVDVRDKISGVIVEDYGSNTEKVKIGDTLHVDVQG